METRLTQTAEKGAARASERKIRIGLLGLGTVGGQVYRSLTDNREALLEKTGFSFYVDKILVREPEKKRAVDVPAEILTTKPEAILEDPEIRLVVEVLGGTDPASSYIKRALEAGKSVVTANKAVMATDGEKLLEIAASRGADLFFEASVAGAIPILRPLQESLATDRILEVSGIVNGTTNYILSQMTQNGSGYDEALKQAQKLGYAEPDPTFDVTGMDAAYKVAILAFLAFGLFAKGEDVARQGITGVHAVDIQNAKDLGYRIKLLAKARAASGTLSLSVAPTLVPAPHPLYNVEGPYNAILVKGERFGDVMFYGQGAGGVPTSTAIVSDVVQAARNAALGTGGKSIPRSSKNLSLQSTDSTQSRFYLRLVVDDKPGTLASLAQIFSEAGVSFAAVIQKENTTSTTDIIFLTHVAMEGPFRKAVEKVERLPFVNAVKCLLRVE